MLKIVRGRSWSFDATIYDTYVAEGDPGNVPTNHTGWTIRSQIRTKVGNKVVANLNVTFPVPTAGTVAIRHDRVFTRSLPIGSFWWDVVATDPSGIDHVYVEPEPIEVHDHPTDPANSTYDFVPGGGGAVYHTHSISDITGLQALLDDRLPPDGGTIARYLRGDNTWQLLNKSAVGLSLVENVTLSTWAGSANITQLGTVISGSWQGSRIAPAYLGDGTSIETKFLRGDGTWQTVSGGGAYIDLSDASTVNLPSVNTPLATALSGKAPASGISPSAISGTAVITTDARLSDARTPTAHTHPASEISDSTATGRSILTAANQSAARTSGLGAGATGDALFTAESASAARTTLGLATTDGVDFTRINVLSNSGANGGFQWVTSGTLAGLQWRVQSGNIGVLFIARAGQGDMLSVNSGMSIGWSNNSSNAHVTGTHDLRLWRDGAGTLAQRNGTNAQTSLIYGTYTDASNYRRLSLNMSAAGVAQIVAEGAGTGSAGNELQLPSNTTFSSASLTRTNLGSGATGDELFQALTPAVARTTLGFDGMVPKVPFPIFLESDFTTSSTSFVNATGLSFSISANKKYAIQVYLAISKNDANGLQYQLTGPSAPVTVSVRALGTGTAATNSATTQLTAFSTASSTTNTYNGDGAVFGSGVIANGSNAGTVQLQLRAVTGGTARIYAGSYIQITEL